MHIRRFIYNSETATETALAVRDHLGNRGETVDVLDVGTADSADDARREAMLTVGEATRIGSKPDAIFDDEGRADFSAGVLILDRENGRRELHVGSDALDALSEGDR